VLLNADSVGTVEIMRRLGKSTSRRSEQNADFTLLLALTPQKGRQSTQRTLIPPSNTHTCYFDDGVGLGLRSRGELSGSYKPRMKKTSLTRPLQIAALIAGPEFGRVGITFCPGKHDRNAVSGHWDRDLSLDLDAIRDWGAAAIVTLVERRELNLLRVERLGEEVLRRGMSWFHLPIVDVSTPDEKFERQWDVAGDELRTLLRGGGDVLVHCKGGLGRAGTIGARLLVELGTEPATAIDQVRAVRPGAIETQDQERYVLGIGVGGL
jgi:protein-tyrosine phosphatase